jgi:hypothetical protein
MIFEMKSTTISAIRLLLIAVLLHACAVAQRAAGFWSRAALSSDLQSSLQERFSRFTEAQATGRWDEVAELLGKYRYVPSSDHLYSNSYKDCLIERMREVRMLDFDYSIRRVFIVVSTDGHVFVQGRAPLNWHVQGMGTFRTSSREWKQATDVVAYRYEGQWYFTPPQQGRGMQDEWEKAHYVEADFLADRVDEISVVPGPMSPVQITDLHVYMNRRFPSIRDLSLRLKNKTSKAVTAFSIRVGDENGFSSYGLHRDIPPHGSSEEIEIDTTAYADYCDGNFENRMLIDDVTFSDGSIWKRKKADDQSVTNSRRDK